MRHENTNNDLAKSVDGVIACRNPCKWCEFFAATGEGRLNCTPSSDKGR